MPSADAAARTVRRLACTLHPLSIPLDGRTQALVIWLPAHVNYNSACRPRVRAHAAAAPMCDNENRCEIRFGQACGDLTGSPSGCIYSVLQPTRGDWSIDQSDKVGSGAHKQ